MVRISVAEDDASARMLVCAVLKRAGFDPLPVRMAPRRSTSSTASRSTS